MTSIQHIILTAAIEYFQDKNVAANILANIYNEILTNQNVILSTINIDNVVEYLIQLYHNIQPYYDLELSIFVSIIFHIINNNIINNDIIENNDIINNNIIENNNKTRNLFINMSNLDFINAAMLYSINFNDAISDSCIRSKLIFKSNIQLIWQSDDLINIINNHIPLYEICISMRKKITIVIKFIYYLYMFNLQLRNIINAENEDRYNRANAAYLQIRQDMFSLNDPPFQILGPNAVLNDYYQWKINLIKSDIFHPSNTAVAILENIHPPIAQKNIYI